MGDRCPGAAEIAAIVANRRAALPEDLRARVDAGALELFEAERIAMPFPPPVAVEIYPALSFSLRMFVAVRRECEQHKQREIAEELGVTEARVSQMLSGGRNLTLDTVTRLLLACETLNARVKSGSGE